MMTTDVHKEMHISLHESLDELVADWIQHTGSMPSKCSVMDLVQWSYEQTQNPTEFLAED